MKMTAENRPVVLSLKPRWATAIFEGRKTIEIRRRFRLGENLDQRALIYTTAPIKALEGEARITAVRQISIEDIARLWLDRTCVSRAELDAYLGDLGHGTLIFLENAHRHAQPIPLSELRARHDFTAPQSFAYASDGLLEDLKQ